MVRRSGERGLSVIEIALVVAAVAAVLALVLMALSQSGR
jgi:Tfp pilus assembly protein FimT